MSFRRASWVSLKFKESSALLVRLFIGLVKRISNIFLLIFLFRYWLYALKRTALKRQASILLFSIPFRRCHRSIHASCRISSDSCLSRSTAQTRKQSGFHKKLYSSRNAFESEFFIFCIKMLFTKAVFEKDINTINLKTCYK